MDFEKICMMFTMQEPYYGILLSSMNRVEDKTVPTLCVGRKGNVFELHYNPDFIGQFSVDTALELCKHECMHLAFNHFTLFDTPPASATERKLRNIAMDLEVNCYLNRSKMDKNAGGMWCEDFGFEKELGTREYYKLLVQEDEKQQQQQQEQQESSGGMNSDDQSSGSGATMQPKDNQNDSGDPSDTQMQGQGQQQQPDNGSSSSAGDPDEEDAFAKSLSTLDSHDDWPDDEPEAAVEQMKQQIEDMLEMAAQECEKSRGHLPGEMKKRIEAIRNRKKPRPVADWRRYMRRYLGNEFSELTRKSRKRPSKRFPDSQGNRHQRKSHVLVAIDTSGSICLPEYNQFFGQIKTLAERATFHIVECDSRIQHEYDFNGKVPQSVHGGGGTDFSEPVDLFIKNRQKYDALVYFTDGYAPIPHNTPKDTLWVVSSDGDHDRAKYKVNGASVVFIPKKK